MTDKISLKARAEVLRLRLARERAERVRRTGIMAGRGTLDGADVTDLMGGYIVRDDGHSGTVWVGSVGLAPAGPERVSACPAWADGFHRHDGKRGAATTYADFTRNGKKRDHNRAAKGRKRLAALMDLRNPTGAVDSTPTGCLPSAPVDTLTHGRATATMRYRAARDDAAEPSRYARIMRDGAWRTFDRYTGEIVTLEKATLAVGGDWRNPATATKVRGAFYVPTGETV